MVQLLQTTDLLVIYTEEWLVPTLKNISVIIIVAVVAVAVAVVVGGSVVAAAAAAAAVVVVVVVGGALAVKIDYMMDISTPERFKDRGKY